LIVAVAPASEKAIRKMQPAWLVDWDRRTLLHLEHGLAELSFDWSRGGLRVECFSQRAQQRDAQSAIIVISDSMTPYCVPCNTIRPFSTAAFAWLKIDPIGSVCAQWHRDLSAVTRTSMPEETIDALCDRCGQAFSAFLHEMADKNSKVVCPTCRENVDCDPPPVREPVTKNRVIKRII
jgi:hypothetical protein